MNKKSFAVVFGVIAVLRFALLGCPNDITNGDTTNQIDKADPIDGLDPPDETSPIYDRAQLITFVGNVSNIYSATNNARFFTGQIIDGKLFEGNLVEYHSVKQSILDYVESLPSNNALVHQHYESAVYDPSKKYVEFSTYTDVDTGKIVEVELRIFFGDFMETFNTEYWYAKSVRFNPYFTKNLDTGERVSFGGVVVITPPGTNNDNNSGGSASTPAVDTGTEIAGCAYSDMDEVGEVWPYEHYLLSVTYEEALNSLKDNWGEPDRAIDSLKTGSSGTANEGRRNKGVLFEINDYDYRFAIWDDPPTGDCSSVIWYRQPGRIAPQDTGTEIGDCAYSQRDEGNDSWNNKHYLLSISYEEAMSVLTALWGDPKTGFSLQRGSDLSERAYQNDGVIFEDSPWDYRLVRRLDGQEQWEAVGWNKSE